jgi:hypothetical protein
MPGSLKAKSVEITDSCGLREIFSTGLFVNKDTAYWIVFFIFLRSYIDYYMHSFMYSRYFIKCR